MGFLFEGDWPVFSCSYLLVLISVGVFSYGSDKGIVGSLRARIGAGRIAVGEYCSKGKNTIFRLC